MYTSKTQTSNCLIPSPHLVSEPVFCTYTVYLYFFYDFSCAYLPRHIYMSIRSLICYIVFSTSLSVYVRVVIYMYMICHDKFVSIYPSILICVPTTPTYVSFNLHICYCNVDNPRIHPCIHLPIHQPVNPRIYLSINLSNLAPSLLKFLQADQSHSPVSLYLSTNRSIFHRSIHPSILTLFYLVDTMLV